MSVLCWWFGCEPDPQDPAPPEYLMCARCGENVSYGDMVGDTRHKRLKDRLHWHLYRRWWPARCPDCGHRFGDHDKCDTIPF